MRRAGLGLVAWTLVGCYRGGDGGGDGTGDGTGGSGDESAGASDGETPAAPELGGVGISGVRRLSRDEYDNTVRDLLGDDTRPGTQMLPEDVIDPFDNEFQEQIATTTLIEAIEAAAIDVSTRLLADPERLVSVVGCEATGPADAECMTSFVETFGRRALRRPLTQEEIDDIVALGLEWAGMGDDFDQGVDVVLRTFLQHPHFMYRVELGEETDEAGVYRLSSFEIATRLSYLVWGTTPDDALLDRAEAGELDTSEGIRAAAEEMLLDDRAMDRIDRFHAMWLGYYTLPHAPELTNAMRTETRSLLEKIILTDQTSWLELFTSTGTFLDDTLATHYGLPAPGSATPTWVEYGDSGRQGLLSHGSFLSVAGKFGDTSPTQRGKLIRTRLLCQVVPPPPPDVNVDEPPTSPDSNCKWDRYEAHRSVGACQACHEAIDPIGFGLENYDQEGRFRATDNGAPECEIAGDGTIDGMAFNGPTGLSNLLVEEELIDACIVQQVYRFAMGHEIMDDDARYVEDLEGSFRENGYRFDLMLLDLVSDEAFMFRREEEEG